MTSNQGTWRFGPHATAPSLAENNASGGSDSDAVISGVVDNEDERIGRIKEFREKQEYIFREHIKQFSDNKTEISSLQQGVGTSSDDAYATITSLFSRHEEITRNLKSTARSLCMDLHSLLPASSSHAHPRTTTAVNSQE